MGSSLYHVSMNHFSLWDRNPVYAMLQKRNIIRGLNLFALFYQRERFVKLQRLEWFKIYIQLGVYRTPLIRNVRGLRITDAAECQQRARIGNAKYLANNYSTSKQPFLMHLERKIIIYLAIIKKEVKLSFPSTNRQQ